MRQALFFLVAVLWLARGFDAQENPGRWHQSATEGASVFALSDDSCLTSHPLERIVMLMHDNLDVFSIADSETYSKLFVFSKTYSQVLRPISWKAEWLQLLLYHGPPTEKALSPAGGAIRRTPHRSFETLAFYEHTLSDTPTFAGLMAFGIVRDGGTK